MARSVMPGTVASLVRDRDRVYGAAVTQRCRAANSPAAAPLLHERIEAMARTGAQARGHSQYLGGPHRPFPRLDWYSCGKIMLCFKQ